MTEWTMNRSSLEKGMYIRRPGLDESLEVLTVRNGQAKIKLPDGKTSTIPARAEVEWSRITDGSTLPFTLGASEGKITPETETEREPINPEPEADSAWQTDWTLLDVGSKIEVLGEPGDFTILRLTDSSARIKHNATGQIQPLSIGHKFKIIESGDAKPLKAGKDKKAKAGKKAAAKSPEPLPVSEPETEIEDESEIDSTLPDVEPSDEALAAIENGDEPDDDEDVDQLSEVYEQLEDDNDNDATEEDAMPAPASRSNRSSTVSLMTLGQIAERTGISYPTLVRYVRDHGDRLPSEGEGRSRRYYPEAIEVFNEIRSSTKGGRKPGAGKPANPRKMPSKPVTAKPRTERTERTERSHETAAPYAAPAKSKVNAQHSAQPPSSSTIDHALATAIDHARAQMDGLQSLIDNLEVQRESLKLWS